jgi:hypothetical protein
VVNNDCLWRHSQGIHQVSDERRLTQHAHQPDLP